MSLLKGSLTYTRFFVDTSEGVTLDAAFVDRALEALAARPFQPLDPAEDVTERVGWCQAGDPFATTLTHADVCWNEHLVLGFRVDRWVVPPALVKAKVREAEVGYLERKGRARTSKKEKAELKDLVVKRLRKQLAPSTRSVDLALSLDEGVVRFFSHTPKLGEAMRDLFRTTFEVALIPEAPYTTAQRLGVRGLDAIWDALAPTDLANAATLAEGAR